MKNTIKIKARYKSYCFVCENEVNIGDHISLSNYVSDIDGQVMPCWRHIKCA